MSIQSFCKTKTANTQGHLAQTKIQRQNKDRTTIDIFSTSKLLFRSVIIVYYQHYLVQVLGQITLVEVSRVVKKVIWSSTFNS